MLTLFIDHLLRHFPPFTCSQPPSLAISHLDASLLCEQSLMTTTMKTMTMSIVGCALGKSGGKRISLESSPPPLTHSTQSKGIIIIVIIIIIMKRRVYDGQPACYGLEVMASRGAPIKTFCCLFSVPTSTSPPSSSLSSSSSLKLCQV